MKRFIFPLFSALSLIFFLLASFGILSDEKRLPEQNQFGGTGKIYGTGNPSLHYYYDEKNFYYQANVPSWDRAFYELYAYDLETGKCSSVCKRVACTHETADCPIHPLYQGENTPPSGFWSCIDGRFVTIRDTKKKMQIRFWDPFTDASEKLLDIPLYDRISDSMGMSGKYSSFFNDAVRLNDELVLVGFNNKMHIYDNNYNERFSFSCQGLHFPLVAGSKLCWIGTYNELNCIDLETGKIETNILDGLFETREIVSVREKEYPFSAFAFESEIYFPRQNFIYAFDVEKRTLRRITAFDPLTEDEPYACFGGKNMMYYKLGGTVFCMELQSGAVTAVPELPKVPCAMVNDRFIFVTPNTTGTNDIECYSKNGKQVQP